ncbi:hypothetical protein Hanom_Chr16g01523421 [Helianthus anomalus]
MSTILSSPATTLQAIHRSSLFSPQRISFSLKDHHHCPLSSTLFEFALNNHKIRTN